jgi:UDP-sulfoquinovose synthase
MRVFILGIDGYIGWALAQYLLHHGHEVSGIDGGHRRCWVEEVGGESLLPIAPREERVKSLPGFSRGVCYLGDAAFYQTVRDSLVTFQPDAVVCLAQQPSAPYSMKGPVECAETKTNNEVVVTNTLWAMKEVCSEAHFLQIGSMGEYGTPDVPIAEPPFYLGLREEDGT